MVVTKQTARRGFAKHLADALTDAGVPDDRHRIGWVAKTFGITRAAARKWLSGESHPDTARLPGIAEKLRTTVEALLSGPSRAGSRRVSEPSNEQARPSELDVDKLASAIGLLNDLMQKLAVPLSNKDFARLVAEIYELLRLDERAVAGKVVEIAAYLVKRGPKGATADVGTTASRKNRRDASR